MMLAVSTPWHHSIGGRADDGCPRLPDRVARRSRSVIAVRLLTRQQLTGGCLIVPPGYADPIRFEAGTPHGASHVSSNGTVPPGRVALDAVAFQARRAVEIGRALKTGLAA